MKEYNLTEMWKSPNGTIRAILDGTVFRTPILLKGITPYIPTWTKPITIARHAYGDLYKNVEMRVPENAKAELVVTKADGTEERVTIHEFLSLIHILIRGVVEAFYNGVIDAARHIRRTLLVIQVIKRA